MQILTVWYHALLEVQVCSASASSSRPPHQVPELYQHFTLKKGATEVWGPWRLKKTSSFCQTCGWFLFSHCCYEKASFCNLILAFSCKCSAFLNQEITFYVKWNVPVNRRIVKLKKTTCGSVGLLPFFCLVTTLHNNYSLVTWLNGCPASRWPNRTDFIFGRDVKGTLALIEFRQGWWHLQDLVCFENHSTDTHELHTSSHSADCELFEPPEPWFERECLHL